MRILTPEQAISRLTADKNVARCLYTDRIDAEIGHHSRRALPLEVKSLVHAHSVIGMKGVEIANLFGLSPSRVARISNGNKSSKAGNIVPDHKLQEVMKTVNETVAEKATSLVMAALEQVSAERLSDPKNKLRDVTGAAKDLASIVEKVSPKEVGGNIAAVVLMGTAPFQADRYKVLETSAVVVK